jgi:hypothetical protein
MESSVLSLPARANARTLARDSVLHWQLAAVMFAATSVIVGVVWDISWHKTIGRDTFWTPAHLAIYIGGAVAGLACGFEVLRRSFFSKEKPSDGVTVWRVFNGPLGGWMCIWGAGAMLTSAPFDDWWHAAYGLDVKIVSPPHTVLALGFVAIVTGALVMALAAQSRSHASPIGEKSMSLHRTGDGAVEDVSTNTASAWIVAYGCGLVVTMLAIFTTEFSDRVLMHSGLFYSVASLAFPFALVSAGRAVRLRFPATAAAFVYTLAMCLQVWLLPLFAASPKLGPIRQTVTHMVPLDFPLLLIVPAIAIDLLLRRTENRNAWLRALMLGVTFVVVFALVQWPFADFLMSEGSRNAFFRTDNFAYMIPMDWLGPLRKFRPEPMSSTVKGFGIALVLAVLSARGGLAWGNWLRTVRR